jgi:hypothetical protein
MIQWNKHQVGDFLPKGRVGETLPTFQSYLFFAVQIKIPVKYYKNYLFNKISLIDDVT